MVPVMPEDLQPLSDEELARAAQAGSSEAFDTLTLRYVPRLYSFLVRRTGSPEDAEDLVQETFVAAFRHLGRYDPARPFVAWILTIARRKAASLYRGRRPTVPLDHEPIDPRNPETDCARSDDHRFVWETARRALDERQFTALWLRYEEAASIPDLAHSLRVSRTHAKVILHRARRRLCAALGRLSAVEANGSRRADIALPEPGGTSCFAD